MKQTKSKYSLLLLLSAVLFLGSVFAQDSNVVSPTDQLDTVHQKLLQTDTIELLESGDSIPEMQRAKQAVADTTVTEDESILPGMPVSFDDIKAPSFHGLITPTKIVWTIIFLLFGFVGMRIISIMLKRIGRRSVKYRIAVKRIEPIVKITVWVFIVFIIIQAILRPPNAMVVAFFTSISVAVGFAAQDLLKNIFGGLMILFDRPFQIGDKIRVGNEYGEVTNIGLRSTRIVTAEDSAIAVPNAVMMNSSISNSNTGETNCQVVAEFYLPISIDTQQVRDIALQAAKVSRYIYLNKPVVVVFSNEIFAGRTIYKMKLKAYVADLRYEFAFKSDMTETTMRELWKAGVITESLLE